MQMTEHKQQSQEWDTLRCRVLLLSLQSSILKNFWAWVLASLNKSSIYIYVFVSIQGWTSHKMWSRAVLWGTEATWSNGRLCTPVWTGCVCCVNLGAFREGASTNTRRWNGFFLARAWSASCWEFQESWCTALWNSLTETDRVVSQGDNPLQDR